MSFPLCGEPYSGNVAGRGTRCGALPGHSRPTKTRSPPRGCRQRRSRPNADCGNLTLGHSFNRAPESAATQDAAACKQHRWQSTAGSACPRTHEAGSRHRNALPAASLPATPITTQRRSWQSRSGSRLNEDPESAATRELSTCREGRWQSMAGSACPRTHAVGSRHGNALPVARLPATPITTQCRSRQPHSGSRLNEGQGRAARRLLFTQIQPGIYFPTKKPAPRIPPSLPLTSPFLHPHSAIKRNAPLTLRRSGRILSQIWCETDTIFCRVVFIQLRV